MSAPGDHDRPEVVASAGALDPVVAALREFLHRSGALRAVAAVEDEPGAGPAIVDCARLEPIEVQRGERTVLLPHAIELESGPGGPGGSIAVPEVHQLPPFEVDVATAKVAGPPGAVAHLASAVRALADALGGHNVAMAQFATDDPDAPLGITARAGGADPLVLSLGEEEFEMDPGWP